MEGHRVNCDCEVIRPMGKEGGPNRSNTEPSQVASRGERKVGPSAVSR